MLVLNRLKSEKVDITLAKGYKGLTEEVIIEVIVVETFASKVKLGFTADKDITIHREEVTEKRRLALERRGKLMYTPLKPSKPTRRDSYGSDYTS